MVNPVTEKAKELVSQGSIEAAIGYLLQGRSPDDGDVQLEIARFLDSLGQESKRSHAMKKQFSSESQWRMVSRLTLVWEVPIAA